MAQVLLIFTILLLVIVSIKAGALEVADHNKSVGSSEHADEPLPFSNGNHTSTTASTPSTTTDYDDSGDYNGSNGGSGDGINRIGFGNGCSKDNILVDQGPTSPLPSGVPTYTVNIENVCLSGSCSVSNIHLNCGWFSSDRLINPKVFRRVGYDDCLVNDGEPLNPGESVSFQYANIFQYPLAVSSVDC